MTAFNIAIIGAGPAGCMLARLLVRSDIQVTIFEGEASPNTRAQGGTLDLHEPTGLAALREAGLYDEFLRYARFDAEAFSVTDKNLKSYIKLGGSTKSTSRGRPEIDRPQLRSMLFNSLPQGLIRWGHRLRRVSEDLSLYFDHGVERGFDLVIGADGAWSKVRPLLTEETPIYSGISGVAFIIPNVEQRYPDLHKLVNHGTLFAFSDGRSIMSQQMGDGSLSVYDLSVRGEDWKDQCGYDTRDITAVKSAIAKECQGWAPELLQMTQVVDDDSAWVRSLYMLPIGHRWNNRPGITLIGDAAHLMTPFAGEGVNLALEDAMNLAHAIIKAQSTGKKDALIENVRVFEEEMFKRAAKWQGITYSNMEDMFFTKGAPRTVIERYVVRAITDESGRIMARLISIIVYTYYWIFKLFY
ncbi:hypothetical protein MMC12_006980 [Toensbergia leucococca]|nr:hypothetical protein [Toensbergia leucococca]